jgi:hypothetical protein
MGGAFMAQEKPDTSVTPETEGEGSRSADRTYREHATRHAASGTSEEAAREAKEALEGKERDELEEAEREGKSRAKSHHDQRC